MTTLTHALFGLTLTLTTWRALTQDWPDHFGDPAVASALRLLIPFAAVAGSVPSIAAAVLAAIPRDRSGTTASPRPGSSSVSCSSRSDPRRATRSASP